MTYWDVANALALLGWTRRDLTAALGAATRQQPDEPIAGALGGSISGIVGHIASVKPGQVGRPRPPSGKRQPNPIGQLDQSVQFNQACRVQLLAHLRGIVEDEVPTPPFPVSAVLASGWLSANICQPGGHYRPITGRR
jgi:hypothetical protein